MKIIQKTVTGFILLRLKLLAFFSKKKAAEKAFELFCTPFSKPIKNVPGIFERSTLINFKLNNLNVHGYRWNHPNKHKVLLLHGFASAAYKFSSYAEALVDKGYEVFAFDAPAHGNSQGKTLNVLTYSKMIKKVIELYGPFNSFMAHSFGGLALALTLEDIPQDAETHVVFIAPLTEISTSIDIAFSALKLKDAAVRKEMDTVIFKISGKETAWFSIRRAMYHIKAKVLWIHDEEDEATPLSDALKVKEDAHPNVEFMVTKGLGHRRIYHDVDIKKLVVGFL